MRVKLRILLAAFFVLCGSLSALAGQFADVPEDYWAAESLAGLTSRGVVEGYSDGYFHPLDVVTRAQLAKIVTCVLGNNEQDLVNYPVATFTDVDKGHWAFKNIELAREIGIMKGQPGGEFHPDEPVTRLEVALVMIRAAGIAPQEDKLILDRFTDHCEIPNWALKELATAVNSGLLAGFDDNTLRVNQFVTRVEASVIADRLSALIGQQYDLAGILEEYDKERNKIIIQIDGRLETMDVSPKAISYIRGKPVAMRDLPRSLPVALNLNDAGEVDFLKECSEEEIVKVDWNVGQEEQRRNYSSIKSTLVSSVMDTPKPEATKYSEPQRSMEVNAEEIKADKINKETGVDGSGQVIAIIDSGVDPGHPDLQVTSTCQPKIIDWYDLTDDGRIDTTWSSEADKGTLLVNGKRYVLGVTLSRSGKYHFGYLSETTLPIKGKKETDLNGDGDTDDNYLVLLVDTYQPYKYDRVLIDTNRNFSLADEIPLARYNIGQQFVSIAQGGETKSYNFVLGDIDPAGNYIRLGYDSSGHGTHVTGIASANGKIRGIAPGAQIMVIKAADANGKTTPHLLTEAIRYAVKQGARIVNISMGTYRGSSKDAGEVEQAIAEAGQAVFVAAVGNNGPGLSTLASPGNAPGVIGVGAYISPRMWRTDFGWDVNQDGLWYFSSVGPRDDGAMSPSVIAPGSAISCLPMYEGTPYGLNEGTSMASPQVAGAVALLMDAAGRQSIEFTPGKVKRALEMGATPVAGLLSAEQGYGLIDVSSALYWLGLLGKETPLSVRVAQVKGKERGVYGREYVPGRLEYEVTNFANVPIKLIWSSTASWLKPEFQETSLPPSATRRMEVYYQVPDKPGIYSGILTGTLPGEVYPVVEVLSTVTVPERLDQDRKFKTEGELAAGQFRRYYMYVPPDTDSLRLSLAAKNDGSGYLGRIRFHLFDPNGELVKMSDYAGFGPDQVEIKSTVDAEIKSPYPGTWEVVLYSSATLSLYDKTSSQYRLEFGLNGVEDVESPKLRPDWIVGVSPYRPSQKNAQYMSLTVLDRTTKKPVEGFITINGHLYNIKNGRVSFLYQPGR